MHYIRAKRLSFKSTDLVRGPASLPFRPARDLTHKDIWQLVNSLALEDSTSQKILQYMFSNSQY